MLKIEYGTCHVQVIDVLIVIGNYKIASNKNLLCEFLNMSGAIAVITD